MASFIGRTKGKTLVTCSKVNEVHLERINDDMYGGESEDEEDWYLVDIKTVINTEKDGQDNNMGMKSFTIPDGFVQDIESKVIEELWATIEDYERRLSESTDEVAKAAIVHLIGEVKNGIEVAEQTVSLVRHLLRK